jgi:hypothetical protein
LNLAQSLSTAFPVAREASVDEILDVLDDTAFGTLLLLLTALSLIPYASYFGGMAIALVGWQIWQGFDHPRLPLRIRNYRIDTGKLVRAAVEVERLAKRFGTGDNGNAQPHRPLAVVVMISGATLAVPLPLIPLNNVLPALAVIFAAFALLKHSRHCYWLAWFWGAVGFGYIAVVLALLAPTIARGLVEAFGRIF